MGAESPSFEAECASCSAQIPLQEVAETGEEIVCVECQDEGSSDTVETLVMLVFVLVLLGSIAWSDKRASLGQFLVLSAMWSQATVLPHELGHMLAARFCGWRNLGVDMGTGKVRIRWKMFGVPWRFRSPGPSGLCWNVPRRVGNLALQGWLISAAGPAVHLLMLTPVISSAVRDHIWAWDAPGLLWASFLAGNLFDLVYNLLPIDGHDGVKVFGRKPRPSGTDLETFEGYVLGSALTATDDGDTPLARAIVADLLETEGVGQETRATAYAQLAWCELIDDGSERLEKAREWVTLAEREDPNGHRVWGVLACIEIEEGRLRAGLERLEVVVADEDDRRERARYLLYMALAEHRLGHADEALQHVRHACYLDRNSPILGRIEGEVGITE